MKRSCWEFAIRGSATAIIGLTASCLPTPSTVVDLPAYPRVTRYTPVLTLKPAPLQPNKGRVVVDCVEHSCGVIEKFVQSTASVIGYGVSGSGSGTTFRRLCDNTPCWFDLEYGPHQIVVGTGDLDVSFGTPRFDEQMSLMIPASDVPTVAIVRVGSREPKPGDIVEMREGNFMLWQPKPGEDYFILGK